MIKKIDFAKIMAGLKAAYPRFKLAETSESMELWYQKLGGYDYGILSAAVSYWIDKEKFPPSIAEIKTLCEPKENPDAVIDWGGAWELALKAVKNYGYYREREAMEALRAENETAYRSLKRLGYQTVCMSENLSNERANFRMIYTAMEEYSEKVRTYDGLPEPLKTLRAPEGEGLMPIGLERGM